MEDLAHRMTKVDKLILRPSPYIYDALWPRGRPAIDGDAEPEINTERALCGLCLASCIGGFEANLRMLHYVK